MKTKMGVIYLLIVGCLSGLVFGQVTPEPCLPCLFEVNGYVYDNATGIGIPGVAISCNEATSTSDTKGYYELFIPTCHGAANVIITLDIPGLGIRDFSAYLTCNGEANVKIFNIDRTPAEVRLCGDVNRNGQVDILDALFIAQDSVGLTRPPEFDAEQADVNSDGKINIIDALMVAQYYVGLPVQLQCRFVTKPIRIEDVIKNPENYMGDNFTVTLLILKLEPVTVSDWYGNTQDGFKVFFKDEYAYESSFYITQADHDIFKPLSGKYRNFRLIGTDGPYRESHIAGYPYRISAKPHPDYFGMWTVYIELL